MFYLEITVEAAVMQDVQPRCGDCSGKSGCRRMPGRRRFCSWEDR